MGEGKGKSCAVDVETRRGRGGRVAATLWKRKVKKIPTIQAIAVWAITI